MKGPKVLTGVGCAFFAVSFLALAISAVLPIATDGRTSWDEAMWGIIPGALCTGTSFLMLAGGLVWLMMSRKR